MSRPSDEQALREAFIRRFSAVVWSLADALPAEVLRQSVSEPDPVSGLARALEAHVPAFGRRDPLLAARVRAVAAREVIVERAGGLLDPGEVVAVLGISREALAGRRRRGDVLTIRTPGGEHLYPACQFRGRQVLPGLAEVLAAMSRSSSWAQLDILTAPGHGPGSPSVIERLRAGEVGAAVREVSAIGTHGA